MSNWMLPIGTVRGTNRGLIIHSTTQSKKASRISRPLETPSVIEIVEFLRLTSEARIVDAADPRSAASSGLLKQGLTVRAATRVRGNAAAPRIKVDIRQLGARHKEIKAHKVFHWLRVYFGAAIARFDEISRVSRDTPGRRFESLFAEQCFVKYRFLRLLARSAFIYFGGQPAQPTFLPPRGIVVTQKQAIACIKKLERLRAKGAHLPSATDDDTLSGLLAALALHLESISKPGARPRDDQTRRQRAFVATMTQDIIKNFGFVNKPLIFALAYGIDYDPGAKSLREQIKAAYEERPKR